ncbi:MAG: hypothetical protein ACI8ZM_003034 [Crocinitomix sp.]|jgi:hypothetical protein
MSKRFLFLVILTFLLYACADEKVQAINLVGYFESDLEGIVNVDGVNKFETSDAAILLGGAFSVSTDFARSGVHSVKLDSINHYALNIKLKDLEVGEFVQLSVWVHVDSKDPTLQAHLKGEEVEYRYRAVTNKNDPGVDGWRKQNLTFTIPDGIESVWINVFSGKKVAYFDDFSLTRQKEVPQNELSHQLNLTIPDSSQQTLNSYIMKAAGQQSIPVSCKKYVNASIVKGQDSVKVQMKLKGDWTDHLFSGKESYRVKIKGDLAFFGLKSFSVQHPRARKYLGEWVMHKMAEREGVLTTTYDFVNVKINEINHGVYALEEHFDKQLLESRARREGPILKMDETSFWAANKKNETAIKGIEFPFFEESTISVFKKNRTRKSDQLSKQFDEGKKLLALFKNGYIGVADLFDIDQLAKFYVLMELSGSYHGLRWHNRRFYYNPITQKLEHIAYDILPFIKGRNFESAMLRKLNEDNIPKEFCFDNAILFDADFQNKFFYYLDQKTQPAYLDSLFSELGPELNQYLAAINGEMPDYKFQHELYYDQAAYLRSIIPELKTTWDQKIRTYLKPEDWEKKIVFEPNEGSLFLKDLSVNAYRTIRQTDYLVELENYHTNDVLIRGYKVKDSTVGRVLFDTPISLAGFTTYADTAMFATTLKPKKIYFTVSNNPSLVITKSLMAWEKPKGVSTRMKLNSQFKTQSKYYSISSNEVVFRGDIVVDQLLLIPDVYKVVILPGTTIEFKTGGGIIATNSFYAKGTEEKPIRFFCTDATSNGLTILNGAEAILSHVIFNGLSNLDYENWELTGALTIYETPTSINKCTISGNLSEDALNIIRSDFSIAALNITDTYSDGFDADFCTGHIEKSTFARTGNDCIDFSGSTVLIEAIQITNSGDKGISGGEASALILNNVTINGAVTGVAAKDGSVITGTNITIENVEYALAAFRKKPEYDGAQIDFKTVLIKAAQEKMLVELKSSITIDGKRTLGTDKLDIEALYARFK